MCSWIAKYRHRINNAADQVTANEIPSIEEIQQTLVNINDKPESFLNSTDWLGALEVWFIHSWHTPLDISMTFFHCVFVSVSLQSDILCDRHTFRHLVSHSTHPKQRWHSQIFEYHKILFRKFWRPNHDGRRHGCVFKMHCGHSHCAKWCVPTDCGKCSKWCETLVAHIIRKIKTNRWRLCPWVWFSCCVLFSFVLLVHFYYLNWCSQGQKGRERKREKENEREREGRQIWLMA